LISSNGTLREGTFSVSLMMWKPKGDSTTAETSPGLRAKAACSNSGGIWRRPKGLSSPPFPALAVSSDDCLARAAKSLPARTRASNASAFLRSSAFRAGAVPWGTRTRMWLARTTSPESNTAGCDW
jgi:hypothetical protein